MGIKLEILFELLYAAGAKDSNASAALFFSTVDAVHETFVIDAVVQAEHMANLMGHDVARTHQQVLFTVRVVNAVPLWVIATEGEATNTFCVAGPAEDKVPFRPWVKILIC